MAQVLRQNPGMSLRKMSVKLGVSVWGLSLWFKKHPGFGGYSIKNYSIMDSKIDEIRRLVAENPYRTRRELSEALGVTFPTVSKWLHDHQEIKLEKRVTRVDPSTWLSFDDVRKWAEKGLPLKYKTIAEAFGVSGSMARRWLAARPDVRAWIKLENDRRFVAKVDSLLKVEPGLSYVKLSSRLGVSHKRLRRLVPGRSLRRIAMGEERVKMLVDTLKSGQKMTITQLARHIGVSPTTMGIFFKRHNDIRMMWVMSWYGNEKGPDKDADKVRVLENALNENPRRTCRELAAMLGVGLGTLDQILKRNPRIRALKQRKITRKSDDLAFMKALKAQLAKTPVPSWSQMAKSLGVNKSMVMYTVREYMGISKPRNTSRTAKQR